MRTLRLAELSMEEGEEVLALIWRLIEKHDFETPKLAISVNSNSRMDMRLTFKEAEAVGCVQGYLQIADERRRASCSRVRLDQSFLCRGVHRGAPKGGADDGEGAQETQKPPRPSIGLVLRNRVTDRPAEFDEAFKAVVGWPMSDAVDRLRRSVDELMRATSRVLLAIEQVADERDGLG
jgi:hypothetical protein